MNSAIVGLAACILPFVIVVAVVGQEQPHQREVTTLVVQVGDARETVVIREVVCPLADLHECGPCPLCKGLGFVQMGDKRFVEVVRHLVDLCNAGYWGGEFDKASLEVLRELGSASVPVLLEEWQCTTPFTTFRRGGWAPYDHVHTGFPTDFIAYVVREDELASGWCLWFLSTGRNDTEARRALDILRGMGDRKVVPYLKYLARVVSNVDGDGLTQALFGSGDLDSLGSLFGERERGWVVLNLVDLLDLRNVRQMYAGVPAFSAALKRLGVDFMNYEVSDEDWDKVIKAYAQFVDVNRPDRGK